MKIVPFAALRMEHLNVCQKQATGYCPWGEFGRQAEACKSLRRRSIRPVNPSVQAGAAPVY